ncbi:MAG: serine/threonine protein kinase [Planctomycetes bacterium]|nr:serine/threonine protein kinase [Planctomycetota bacterium]
MNTTQKKLGPFELHERLGGGAQGEVYKAWQPGPHRWVALKVLRRDLAGDPRFLDRFQLEARTCANLEHRNIVPVYDFGSDGGDFYMAMRFVDGESLARRIERGPLPPAEIRRVLEHVGEALDYAHARDVVHRDVKPANVLCNEQGDFLLADFGIAKIVSGGTEMTLDGHTVGTAEFMSPEQCRGDKVTGAADLYSLGVMAYRLLLGEVPFQAESAHAVQCKHIHMAPSFPDDGVPGYSPAVSTALITMLQRALAKAPAQRFASAAEMLQAFDAALATGSIGGPEAPQPAAEVASSAAATVPPPRAGAVWWGSAVACGITLGMVGLRGFAAAAEPVVPVPGGAAVPTAGSPHLPPPANLPLPIAIQPAPRPAWPQQLPALPEKDTVVVLFGRGLQDQAALGADVEASLLAALRQQCADFATITFRKAPDRFGPESAAFDAKAVLGAASEDFVLTIDGLVRDVVVEQQGIGKRKPTYDGGAKDRKVRADVDLVVRLVSRPARDVRDTMQFHQQGVAAASLDESVAAACAAMASDFAQRVGSSLQHAHDDLRTVGRWHDLVLIAPENRADLFDKLAELLRSLPKPGVAELETLTAAAAGAPPTFAGVALPPGCTEKVWRFRCPATRDWLEHELNQQLAWLVGQAPTPIADQDTFGWRVQ